MPTVDCLTRRAALSARLDGESGQAAVERTDEHLGSCVGCQSWRLRAGELTRSPRMRTALAVPDLSGDILANAPSPPHRSRWDAMKLSKVDIGRAAHRVIAAGAPAAVLTVERVSVVFGVRSAIVPHPITGRPHFVTASAFVAAEADRVPAD